MWETWVRSLGWKDPLEKEMATHSSTLAWKIPWTEEAGRLHSTGLQRVRHDWATSLHSFYFYRGRNEPRAWHRLSEATQLRSGRGRIRTHISGCTWPYSQSFSDLSPGSSGAQQQARQDGAQLNPEAIQPWLSLPSIPLGANFLQEDWPLHRGRVVHLLPWWHICPRSHRRRPPPTAWGPG